MAAILFLSPPHPPSNTHHYRHHSHPISLSLIPNSFKNPNPNPPSNPLKPLAKIKIQSSNSNSSVSTEPIKMPTAPWMKSPLLIPPSHVLDLSKPRKKKTLKLERSLTGKISGGRGKKAMKKIFEGVEKLKETPDSGETQRNPEESEPDFEPDFSKVRGRESMKRVFEEIGKVEETQDSWETQKNPEEIELDFSLGGDGDLRVRERMPWEREERVVFGRVKRERVVTAAELSLDGELLERLRGKATRMRKWIMVKKTGVTQAVADQIGLIWRNDELVMLKFDLPLCRNMDRAREIVETKTGGLVVWSKKDALVVYRGCNFQSSRGTSPKMLSGFAGGQETSSLNINHHKLKTFSQVKSDERIREGTTSIENGDMEAIPINGSLYEREADRLLDGLGPRFIDWWWPKPLPVDADLLPEVVPGFKPPFRLCPPHARAKLTDDELTYLRKLARQLPTHFVLGRNRKLQGLAAAILKLWEKCYIVKIAVKWGIPNTDNAQMAYELKCLTGGVLLLRNKFFIILYRGKDFLPCGAANLVVDREMELRKCQLQEEAARQKAIETFCINDESFVNTSTSGTLQEFEDIQSECAKLKNGNTDVDVQLEAEKERLKKQLKNQARKRYILKMKIARSAKELGKLNSAWSPAELDADQEMITQEEKECFRKIGLKMDRSLVLGRRGIFDGVIEGLRQHWKHREIVKVITMQRLFSQVIYTAKQLEAETGGILVSVDKLKQGHAIIIYRGKNYRRPLKLVPQNLLNKKEALHRSLEMQRIGSLKFFAHQRQQEISQLNCKLADLEQTPGIDQSESNSHME
ncbi:Chloroplastic group IIA intron splicing facilitator like [Actinidia chinensis var. chinensis]|uniref:Chloroplastic group IIA intron splicing facilitator like n=1 Tax=Actinidia chinensis var. chinensis TaxID=1590841 RepID=A0A2R6RKP2_ACTCC|nr:Chloroplastic group IIA intron splicing facilitator like [Actinidia chinensis var. chinensis]